jgi:nitrous oxidase accessory protein NosD
VRPDFSVGGASDVFAWPIIDLAPGTAYEVEVRVTSGAASDLRSASFTTRALPPPAGAPNKTVAPGSSIQTAFNGLNPGDVLEIRNGTYDVNNLVLNRAGNSASPIYIRGESRSGVILSDANGAILDLQNASNVIIENLTLRGSGTDTGTNASQVGIQGGASTAGTTRTTIRNVTITGVDRAIAFFDEANEALVYDNTIVGNNLWNAAFLGDNRTWNDDGINLPGFGNVAFNNTISGFGDTFAYAQHSGGSALTVTRGVHYYRNDIRRSLDDLAEFDYAQRNVSFYDNRSHNSGNCGSLDPLDGGPLLYARNVCINPARPRVHKWNNTNTGQFFYNNTFIGGVSIDGSAPDISGWFQPNDGAQRAYGFRNNLWVYRGSGNMLWLESTGHDPIDWTHNSWFPNRQIQWGGAFSNLAAAQNGLPDTTPIFSGTNRRMQNDNITVSNPWTTTVTLGSNSLTEVMDSFAPALAAGTTPKNSGVEIPNITDGFAGTAPDRGAVIEGRPMAIWGDRGASGQQPQPPSNLTAQ